MSALVNKLFDNSQSDAIRKLWSDKTSRKEIKKQIGWKLIENEDFIEDLPLTQIMFLTSLADFASTEQECVDIAEIIMWGIKQKDILPSVVEHRKKELAYRCLISLGFFKKRLTRRYNKYGAPSPDFYRRIGISAFIYIGKEDIGNHFCQWEHFMGEFFI